MGGGFAVALNIGPCKAKRLRGDRSLHSYGNRQAQAPIIGATVGCFKHIKVL